MKKILCWAFLLSFYSLNYAQVSNVKTVNHTAAVNCLTKSCQELAAENWSNAVFYANLGAAYDTTIADFSYILAVCYSKLDRSIREQLICAETACMPDMQWRYYDKKDAQLLCAKLYAHTKRYREAFDIVSAFQERSADIDYIKVQCLYGFNRKTEARRLLSEALDTWAFDFRFARIFLQNERNSEKTNETIGIAEKIIARSYVWENSNPEILVLLSPFEPNKNETIRRLKIYREMYAPFNTSCTTDDLYIHSYAVLLSLNFGIISEKIAVEEFFNMSAMFFDPMSHSKITAQGFYAPHLEELCRLVTDNTLRSIIAGNIVSYKDCVFDCDRNGNLQSIIFYESGRPTRAVFDSNLDGVSDMSVSCNFGIPTEVLIPATQTTVIYDEYPHVNRASFEGKQYIMRPLDLQFQPVKLAALDLNLFDLSSAYSNMYVIVENKAAETLSSRALTQAAVYVEQKLHDNVIERVLLSNGVPVSSQSFIGEKLLATAQYKNGIISSKTLDRDCDGYFETYQTYDVSGKLLTVSIDVNRNKIYEYTEKHEANSIQKIWDEDEDGEWEILYTQMGDYALVKWLHPITNEIIQVDFVKFIPQSIQYLGVKKQLYASAEHTFFWIGKKIEEPALNSAIEKNINNYFNQSLTEVVSYSVTINNINVFAVKSGGVIFAQIIEAIK